VRPTSRARKVVSLKLPELPRTLAPRVAPRSCSPAAPVFPDGYANPRSPALPPGAPHEFVPLSIFSVSGVRGTALALCEADEDTEPIAGVGSEWPEGLDVTTTERAVLARDGVGTP
jgi:hypothetical protein